MAEAQGKLASEQEARDVAEGAREQEWENISFAGSLFSGDFDLGPLCPPPRPTPRRTPAPKSGSPASRRSRGTTSTATRSTATDGFPTRS